MLWIAPERTGIRGTWELVKASRHKVMWTIQEKSEYPVGLTMEKRVFTELEQVGIKNCEPFALEDRSPPHKRNLRIFIPGSPISSERTIFHCGHQMAPIKPAQKIQNVSNDAIIILRVDNFR
jgi:hypothetical protein